MILSVCSDCSQLVLDLKPRPLRSSDSDEEVEVEGGRNVQRLQAESRRRVREEDGERLLGVQEELRRIVSVLERVLQTQVNMQGYTCVTHEN